MGTTFYVSLSRTHSHYLILLSYSHTVNLSLCQSLIQSLWTCWTTFVFMWIYKPDQKWSWWFYAFSLAAILFFCCDIPFWNIHLVNGLRPWRHEIISAKPVYFELIILFRCSWNLMGIPFRRGESSTFNRNSASWIHRWQGLVPILQHRTAGRSVRLF